MEKATFAAGCFWGVEAEFRKIPGVVNVTVGYTGGTVPNPSYRDACTGMTHYAESALVEFDPERVSYRDLLNAFWEMHDPTTPDRQGPDFGAQYRSAIFFHTPEQEAIALASKKAQNASGRFATPIVTEIQPATNFYPAEGYHQRYFEKRGPASCRIA